MLFANLAAIGRLVARPSRSQHQRAWTRNLTRSGALNTTIFEGRGGDKTGFH